jgi:uncharacterized iron-regulated protein
MPVHVACAIAIATIAVPGGPPDALAESTGAPTSTADACVPVGAWRLPANGGPEATTEDEVIARAIAARSVLLGETHDSFEHHRWQLQVLAALHARHPDLVIALEMFPRRVQPVLDRWVAGELDEAAFLRDANWRTYWNQDPELYLPIFHFARMNRVPLVALNVDRSFIRAVTERGLAAVPPAEREGVGVPAAAEPAYEDMLFAIWQEHLPAEATGQAPDRSDPRFQRFVESQLVWDRAMAEGIAAAAQRYPGAAVAALMGSGHVMNGWGVPRQMQALGLTKPLALLPFDREEDCADLVAGFADAVFGVAAPPTVPAPPRPRLGITLRPGEDGVAIGEVTRGSIAEQAGLRAGDVIVSIAGVAPGSPIDVAAAVMRQAPGTWLPITVRRDGRSVEIVARFPPPAAK